MNRTRGKGKTGVYLERIPKHSLKVLLHQTSCLGLWDDSGFSRPNFGTYGITLGDPPTNLLDGRHDEQQYNIMEHM